MTMNKYAARGLLFAAVKGKRIIVLTRDQQAVKQALDEFDIHQDDHVQVSRLNGAESIRCQSGGQITFHRHEALERLRGYTADVVYLDEDVDRQMGHHLTHHLHAIIATSENGEIIRA